MVGHFGTHGSMKLSRCLGTRHLHVVEELIRGIVKEFTVLKQTIRYVAKHPY